jgi:Lrp/AsnC family transcriptional regulator
MAAGLDKIDMKILAVLQQDASRSPVEIAESVGLSQSPCWRRIQRLKDENYISKVVAIVDRHKVSLKAELFLQVKVLRHDQVGLEEFKRAVAAFPEVLECYFVLGVFDFLLRIVTEDMGAYEKFYFEKLSRVANIAEVNSFVATEAIKSTTELPLCR